jgi:hypothetical protein
VCWSLKLNSDSVAAVFVGVDAAHTLIFEPVALARFGEDVAIAVAQPPAIFLLFILINLVLHFQPPYGVERSPLVYFIILIN